MDADSHNRTTLLKRQAKLANLFERAGLHALVLNAGPSLVYLTGLHFHLSERPVLAIFTPGAPVTLVLPELEAVKTKGLPYPANIYLYGEDPAGWLSIFRRAAIETQLDKHIIGADPRQLRLLELGYLQAAAPKAEFISAEELLAKLRMYKDAIELTAMRKAAQIAQLALISTLPLVRIGMTERELAAELTMQLLRGGSDSEIPFTPIVSSGPNSANPHASPSNRALTPGDMLVIDWGASYNGYISDITRTFAVGEVESEMEQIATIVLQANTAGRLAIRPGVPAGEVDQAARSVIEAAGYGRFFTHRTGHGLGMEGHEEPYIRSGSDLPLAAGMTFTIEPGIYLPDRNGVRIEDDVVVTEQGMESLTDLPRELKRLG